MTKREKLLAKASQTPGKLTFDEFEAFLRSSGWVFKRQRGSHRVWISPNNRVLPIQSDGGNAKGYQVRQSLLIMENENG